MITKTFLISILLVITTLLYAQEKISLTEVEKVREYLSLNESQYKSIKHIVNEIETVLEEDKKIIEQLKERIKNGDEPGFFEKIGVKRGRDGRSGEIEDLIDEIEDQLNDQQKNKFKNIEKPELKSLEKKEIFGK